MKTKLFAFIALLLPLFGAHAQRTSALTSGTITGPSLIAFSLPSGSGWVERSTTFANFKLALALGGASALEVGTTSGTVAAGDHAHAFSSITGLPATLAGHGITDGLTLTGTGSGLTGLNGSAITSGLVPIARGGTGTATPGLVAGSNVTITGTWPNQTVTSTASGGGGGTLGTAAFTAASAYDAAGVSAAGIIAERSVVRMLTNVRITPRVGTLAGTGTVTPNADLYDIYDVGALTGNLILATPTGTPVDGQTLLLRMAQDSVGGWTVTPSASYVWTDDITAAFVPVTASKKWHILYRWSSAASKWVASSVNRGTQ